MPTQKLKPTFHRTFSLSRPSIQQILSLANAGYPITKQALAQRTTLGTIYQESMPRYARGCGLLDEHKQLTSFGQLVADHDLDMAQLHTQWLMHYHLASPHGPGPAFWNYLVTTYFRSGNIFTGNEISEHIGAFTWENTGKEMSPRSLRATATVFLGTYYKPDGLGSLGILSKIEKDQYRVQGVFPPDPWVIAYALLDYWQAHYGDRLTINLNDLTTTGGFASLFVLSEQQMEQILDRLQQENILDLYRVAPPYQVVLLQTDPNIALEKLYHYEP